LHAVEEVLVDERLMPPLDLLVVDRDESEVVAVLEHQGELVDRHLLGLASRCRSRPKPAVVQLVRQVGQGVVTSCVQLERQTDERSALWVDGDGADLAALGLGDADVEVAEFGHADRAAVADLLAHLVADVGTTRLRLVLVDGVDDLLDHDGLRVLTHVEDGRDDASADLLQVALDHASVDRVPEHSVEVVDDDVVDVLLLLDPSDHLLERGPLVDAGGGAPRLDELTHDVGVQGLRLALARFPLGWDRYPLGVEVGVDLSRRGDS
jgi:hypothetical protein